MDMPFGADLKVAGQRRVDGRLPVLQVEVSSTIEIVGDVFGHGSNRCTLKL